ncbi:hypothetical protein PITCH_A420024 [uncultured Desulfobacterium sp.]|uniref:Uncharacterized protein n=1 Tax=uncultured Desulfobacterium sp. TaxID=201089 RepID=A0A445MZZ9_9BACT|nr:hypothetical protein PITCH_A420024 [uncultured Desulfobacterium sp.]
MIIYPLGPFDLLEVLVQNPPNLISIHKEKNSPWPRFYTWVAIWLHWQMEDELAALLVCHAYN